MTFPAGKGPRQVPHRPWVRPRATSRRSTFEPLENRMMLSAAPLSPPLALLPGDANQDLVFDQRDLLQVLLAGKYMTGQRATWAEGDFNGGPGGRPGAPPAGDGRFDQQDIMAALRTGAYNRGAYAAILPGGIEGDEQTSIIYNPLSGEIAVDAPASLELTSINIDSAAAIFTGAPAENLGEFSNDSDNNIFKATFGGSFGSLSFGNVAETRLSEEFVRNDLTVVGSLAGGSDLGPVDLIYKCGQWPEDLTGADFAGQDLSGACFANVTLSGADFHGANLTEARFDGAILTGANFTGATVQGASFDSATDNGLTCEQLYSTASYADGDLSGIQLIGVDLTGANLAGKDLSGSYLSSADLTSANLSGANLKDAYLSRANLSDAVVQNANLDGATGRGFTAEQLYATAGYQQGDLSHMGLRNNDLRGWNLAGKDLRGADLRGANLWDANLSRAVLAGTDLRDAQLTGADLSQTTGGGFTAEQLYGTASYQDHRLRAVDVHGNDLAGWSFAGQNLTAVNFAGSDLSGANFQDTRLSQADFRGAELWGASLRGAAIAGAHFDPDAFDGVILQYGQLLGLRLVGDHTVLEIPDHDLPVIVSDRLTMDGDSQLRLVLSDPQWGSTVRVAPGLMPQLGGTLSIGFAPPVDVSPMLGQTFDLFDWSVPLGADNRFERIELPPGTQWDVSDLYTTGQVTLTGLRQTGDVNGDSKFDQLDIVSLLQAGKYLTGGPADWSQGDFNGDGRFDQLDIVAALATGRYLSGPRAARGAARAASAAGGPSEAALVDTVMETADLLAIDPLGSPTL